MGKWWTQYGFPRWGSSSSAQRFLLGRQSRLSAVPFGKWSCHLSCLGQRFLSCHGIGCCCLWENPMSCSSRILWRPDSPAASLKDVAQHARNSGPPRRASQLGFCCPHLFSVKDKSFIWPKVHPASDRKMMKGFSSNSSWIVVLRFLYLLHFSKKTQGPIVPHFEFSWLKTKVTYVFFVSEVTL